jgi:hypothetical protein
MLGIILRAFYLNIITFVKVVVNILKSIFKKPSQRFRVDKLGFIGKLVCVKIFLENLFEKRFSNFPKTFNIRVLM